MLKLCLIMFVLYFAGLCFGQGRLILAEGGRTSYSIITPDDAVELEKTAATDLKKYLRQVTGAEFPIDKPCAGPKIIVGPSVTAKELTQKVDWDALGTDGIVIRTVGKDLVLAGGRPRGTIYAVYTFLQDVVGCRWWAPDAETIPSKPTLKIDELDIVYRPQFELRYYHTAPFRNKAFALKLRQSTGMNYDVAEHTLIKSLLKPDKYYLKHPDWYMFSPTDDEGARYGYANGLKSLKESGKEEMYRLAKQTRRLPYQPCLTSEGALQTVTQEVLAHLKREYPKWKYPPKVVTVAQADGRWCCKCENCSAVAKREGSYSGPLIQFVNAVAERVDKEYPDVLVNTLPFLHTWTPPAHLKPRSNVMIQAAPVVRNQKLPAGEAGEVTEDLKRWSKISSHLQIWEHDTNFRNWVQPHPNYFVLPASLRFYKQLGVCGIFAQGNWGNAGEFQRMRAWVVGQLMWNPDQDERALMKEFLNGYYGPAGPYLMSHIDLLHRAVHRRKDFFLGAYATSTEGWLTLDDLNAATQLFQQAAEAVAGDKTLSYRLRRARLSIDIVWVERYRELQKEAKRTGKPFLGPKDPYTAVERIARDEFNVNSYKEWADFHEYVAKLRKLFPARK